jgi:hypothetical protein
MSESGFVSGIDGDRGFALIRYSPPVTIARWWAAVDAVLRHPAYQGHGFLCDRRGLPDASTPAYVEAVVAAIAHSPALKAVPWAVLVDATPLEYGMGRMEEILASVRGGLRVAAFTDEREAVAWLLAQRAGEQVERG